MSLIGRIKDLATRVATELNAIRSEKQNTLVSGTNIKTVGGQSLLGSGDLPISGDDMTVKATSADSAPGFLDAKVDGSTLEVASNKIQVKDEAITHGKVGSDLKGTQAVAATNVDWSTGAIFTKTLTAATTLTFSNLQANKTITMLVTGNYTLTLPTYCKRIAGTYAGTVANYLQFHCTNAGTGTEEVWYTINKQA